jgi:tRNA C32,U32 (ribose-2'-O)-methylase TrmJ
MRRLRQLFNRARPDLNEVNILRGILSSVERPKRRRPADTRPEGSADAATDVSQAPE